MPIKLKTAILVIMDFVLVVAFFVGIFVVYPIATTGHSEGPR